MLRVFTVNETTRLILPTSQWAIAVRRVLQEMGHIVQLTNQDPYLCVRDDAELKRVDEYLQQTGL